MRIVKKVTLLFATLWALWALLTAVLSPSPASAQPVHLPETLRLYRQTPDGLDYAWAFEYDGVLYIDMGRTGEPAHQRAFPASDWPQVEAEIARLRAEGYAEIEPMAILVVSWPVKSRFALPWELLRRNRLTDAIEAHLGRTGQGVWIDASSGQGTMEIAFLVADYDISRASIDAFLRDRRGAAGYSIYLAE